jgi:hypothetical protein
LNIWLTKISVNLSAAIRREVIDRLIWRLVLKSTLSRSKPSLSGLGLLADIASDSLSNTASLIAVRI